MERMVLVLGVSAGAGGARAVLTHSDQPHLPPIDRCRVPRRAGGGVEEAVFEAIRRMRRSADQRGELITGTAVTCRCPLHAEAIRAAAGHTPLTVVSEPLAQLRYLRFTGRLPEDGTVLLYDLGSSGLTITHADCRTDSVLSSKRSTVLGGDGFDALLRWQLARDGVLTDKGTCRKHREALSTDRVVTATDSASGGRAVLTRSDITELCAAGIHHSVSFVHQLIEQAETAPDAMVLLGGCTRSPSIQETLAEDIELPIVVHPEPETVSARGAVLLATGRPAAEFRPTRARLAATAPGDRRKLIAALAVTATLGATIAGVLVMDRDASPGHSPAPAEHVDTPPAFR
ncbi:Hsp70 family protein [Nocardia sp. NPDC127579]|uniref:Hsp70 family protein n=1 Tax=Nocardia sp. NPDC127579 TaxID=3345402 RepID=UPI00363236B8